jgi:hypothetical protein
MFPPGMPASGNDPDPMAGLDANVVPAMRFMNPNAPIVNNQPQYQNMPSGQVITPDQYMQNMPDARMQALIKHLLGVSFLPGA